jgi:hypothetical protein
MRLRFAALLLCLVFLPGIVWAQEDKDWTYKGNFNFGLNLYFYTGHGQKFPGWKAFCGLSIAATNKHNFLLNYGPSLAVYSKSLGANLNPLTNDVQVDFAHSFSLGYWWGDPFYTKYFRTLGNASYYNTVLDARNAVLLSTIFVFNNHKRHQALGSITGTFGDFTINYYNDGGIPIEWLPISDHFDRYWTGGIGLFFHSNEGYNKVELTFDQFTGYQPLLYEMSSLLGIQVPSYNLQDGKAKDVPPDFNTSVYNIRFFPGRSFGIDAGLIGAFKTRSGIPFGLQDIIHTLGGYALHPNYDVNRVYLGGTYLNARHVSF